MTLNPRMGAVLRASVARPGVGPSMADAVAAAGESALSGLSSAALYHGVSGYLHAAIVDVDGIPALERERLAQARRRVALDLLRRRGDLRHVSGVLDDAGIPWVLVKGPTLGQPVHGAADLRWFNDLDVVVPPDWLAAAMAAFEASGCEVTDRNWTLIRREMKGEVHLRLPLGTELDLHWHLLNEADARRTFPISIGALIERRRTVTVAGTSVPTLHPVDNVVYVALHAVRSGADRLVWLKDIQQLLEDEALPLGAVRERARSWHAELVLSSGICQVDRTLGCRPEARQLLRCTHVAPLWHVVHVAAQRWSPTERATGSGSLARMVARATSDTQWTSLRNLGRKGFAHVRHGRSTDRGPGSISPSNPGSDRFPAGGEADRQGFVADVARRA